MTHREAVEVKRVRANGVGFAYLEQGKGPLVLLLHGFPDTAYTWDSVMPALAAIGYRAVAPFMRGYHPTEIPSSGAYDSDTLGYDALALIQSLGQSNAIVIGHDWGATAGYSAAALDPYRIRLLVTLAVPHPRSLKLNPKLLWTLRHFGALRRANAADRVSKNEMAMVDELVRRWSPAWSVPPDETERVKAAFREPGYLDAALGYYRAIRFRLPSSHKLPISVPTVAFAGEHGTVPLGAFDKARRWFRGRYDVVRVPGGHFLHREHPQAFTAELVRVVSGF